MIHALLLVFSIFVPIATTLAQTSSEDAADRFARYCDQLATPAPEQKLNPNSRVSSFRKVIDSVNNTDAEMQKAIERDLDFIQFRREMAARNFPLSPRLEARYAELARKRCDLTEGAAGDVSAIAHNQATDGQSDLKVSDSGIGAPKSGDSETTTQDGGGSGGGSATDR